MQENTKTKGRIPTRQVRSKVVMGGGGVGMYNESQYFFFHISCKEGKNCLIFSKEGWGGRRHGFFKGTGSVSDPHSFDPDPKLG